MKTKIMIAGKPITEYKIIVSANASEAVLYAAEELKTYIDSAIHFQLSIFSDSVNSDSPEILVGETNRRKLPDDVVGEATEIFCTREYLSLCGGCDRGTIYSVYEYLERFIGWRFFNYDCEVLRDTVDSVIVAGERLVDAPVYKYRQNYFYDVSHKPDFRVKSRQNTSEPIPPKMGGALLYNGFCHTLGGLCPESEYFAEHPEYYGLYKGERQTYQLCLSNPDVLKIVTENVLKRLRKRKEFFISVSQNDNPFYCECENCKRIDEEEGSHAGTLIRFVNQVADAVKVEFPDVRVDTLAYQYTRKLPKYVKPRDNMTIRLCSIECCFRHPMYDDNCEQNALFCNDIREWSTICKDLFIWDYVTDYSHYMMPFPNLSVLRQNMRFYAEHNAKGILPLGTFNGNGSDFDELKAYLLSKLTWNPYMTAAEFDYHMNDFLSGFYGKGWEYLKKYLEILDETTLGEHIGCYASPKEHFGRFIERIDEIYRLFDKAYELAETDEQKQRIRIAKIGPLYIHCCCNHDERKEKEPDRLLADKHRFFNEMKECNIKRAEWYGYADEDKINFDDSPDEWRTDK